MSDFEEDPVLSDVEGKEEHPKEAEDETVKRERKSCLERF